MKHMLIIFLALLGVSGAVAQAAASVADFVKTPNVRSIAISPTGEFMAVIVPSTKGNEKYDKTEMRVINRKTSEVVSSFNFPGRNSVVDLMWVNNTRLMLWSGFHYGKDQMKYSDPNIVTVDWNGENQKTVFGPRAAQQDFASMDILSRLPEDDENILIHKKVWGETANSERKSYIVKLNVNNGKQTDSETVPFRDASYVVLDYDYVLRFVVTYDENLVTHIHYRPSKDTGFEEVASFAEGAPAWRPLDFVDFGKKILVSSDIGRNTNAYYYWDPATKAMTLIASDEQSDIKEWLRSSRKDGSGLLAVRATRPDAPWIPLQDGPQWRTLSLALNAFKGRNVYIGSTVSEGSRSVVWVTGDVAPMEAYFIDGANKKAELLSRSRPWLKKEELSSMQAVTVQARDGLTLPSFLTLPKGREPKNLPAVLLVHGGPFGVYDTWGFDSEVQMLASRGYAVLQVNFRGSGGYGQAFENKGRKGWGGVMQNDLTDATRWLVEKGYADPKRICIMGHSYGGYAALWGVISEPELYRCAIGSMGLYDMSLEFKKGSCNDSDKCRRFMEESMGADPELHAARSPVNHATKIRVPVMLSHGKLDERVPFEHALRMKKAMEDVHRKVEWLEFEDEGHYFANPKNAELFYTRTLEFLDRHIGQ